MASVLLRSAGVDERDHDNMSPFHILFLLFLIIPLVEIYLLIQVGSVIGALFTVFLVVFTAVLGVWLLRIQGFSTLVRVQAVLLRGEIPAIEMLEGAVLLVAGALLLTPGFFTDAIGFYCLVPSLRRAFIRRVLKRFLKPQGSGEGGFTPPRGPRTIEGKFRREDD
jgi:UPF0716 protein FxsA